MRNWFDWIWNFLNKPLVAGLILLFIPKLLEKLEVQQMQWLWQTFFSDLWPTLVLLVVISLYSSRFFNKFSEINKTLSDLDERLKNLSTEMQAHRDSHRNAS